MADQASNGAKAVELKAGARIAIATKVYEDLEKGRKFDEGKLAAANKQIVVNEKGERFIKRAFTFPYPAGLLAGKNPDNGADIPATPNMTPEQFAASIGEWLKVVEQVKAAGGLITYKLWDAAAGKAKTVTGVIPIDMMPTLANLIEKGVSLGIQGPMNVGLANDFTITTGKAAKASKVKSGDQGLDSMG